MNKVLSVSVATIITISGSAFVINKTNKDLTAEKLGEKLFFDPILSSNHTISCSSCHQPNHAFADTVAFSRGVNGMIAARNTPSAMNMSARAHFFLDGRAATLEEQALGPIQNPIEMNLSIDSAVARLNKSNYYKSAFKSVYHSKPNKENLLKAIAAFERTLETGNSAYDAFAKGKSNEISEAAKLGRELFVGKAKCFDCHMGLDFTTDDFKNIGLYNNRDLSDKGRYEVTNKEEDLGRFKVPGLRNVAITAPYMHNGMFRNLKEVVNYYNHPDKFIYNSINRDTAIHALNLSDKEVNALVEFLKSLTDKRFINNKTN